MLRENEIERRNNCVIETLDIGFVPSHIASQKTRKPQCVILNENVVPPFQPGTIQSLDIPNNWQSQNNSATPRVMTTARFFLYCDYQSSSGAVGSFQSCVLCPHSLSWATTRETIKKSYQGEARQEQAVPASTGRAEQMSALCIYAVFGGGSTVAVTDRSPVFFVGVEGSATTLFEKCTFKEEEREQLNHSPSSLG